MRGAALVGCVTCKFQDDSLTGLQERKENIHLLR